MRIKCASIKTSIADCFANEQMITESINEAEQENVDFLLFPELTISGYSCGDIFYSTDLLSHSLNSLINITKYTSGKNVVSILGLPLMVNNKLFNCAAVVFNGKIYGIVPKKFIPNTNEYYEKRWFSSYQENIVSDIWIDNNRVPFGHPLIFSLNNKIKFGIEICEDLWSPVNVSSHLCRNGAEIIFNLSNSNETVAKMDYRKKLVEVASLCQKSLYVYCSGGINESTTDVIYSEYKAAALNGKTLTDSYKNSLLLDVDTSEIRTLRLKSSFYQMAMSDSERLEVNIPKEIIDRFENSKIEREPFLYKLDTSTVCSRINKLQGESLLKKIHYTNRKKLIIGISGGLDSTVALLACVDVFKKNNIDTKNIIGVTMPGPGTTIRTYKNSIDLMKELGITSLNIDIKEAVQKHLKNIQHQENLFDITYEQTQSRERTKILMDLANQEKGIVIGTGDLSEFALGWMSYSGDHISMYALNCGIPKTIIKHLAEWHLNNSKGKLHDILNDIINTPISPELLPVDKNDIQKQSTEKLIGPYIIHDFFLFHVLSEGININSLIQMTEIAFPEYKTEDIKKWLKIFITRFFTRQFKRTCFSDGVQVFDVGLSPRGYWRMPSDVSSDMWLKEVEKL